MARNPIGLVLVYAGLALVVVGLLVWSGGLSWFGRLPGDIRIERENTRVYAPITSMTLVSLAFYLVVAVIRRLR